MSNVKERYQFSETSDTNGPQGTVSQKTQVSVSLLKKEMDRLYMNVIDVNPEFAEDILLETLLTTHVENLHAVSHFKHETFTVLQYALDFGTIVKESIKRTSRWAAKYYTHDRSCRAPFSCCNDGTFAKRRNITRYGGTYERMVRELQTSTPTDG